jgi:hypothetical protein
VNRKIPTVALCAAVFALALFASAAPAAAGDPPITAIKALCTAQGGTFYSLAHAYVVCDSNIAEGFTFSEQQLTAARLLCTRAYGGLFSVSGPPGFPSWYCVYDVKT